MIKNAFRVMHVLAFTLMIYRMPDAVGAATNSEKSMLVATMSSLIDQRHGLVDGKIKRACCVTK